MSRLPTEQRRRQIADAAIRIIGERGLRNFTAAQIAREVGIADGTIFRHFKDKDEIVMAAIERLEEVLTPALPPSEGDALVRLGELFRRRVQAVLSQPGIQALVFSDQLGHAAGPEAMLRLRLLRQRGLESLRALLGEAERQGILRSGVAVDTLLVLLQGAVMSVVFQARDQRLTHPPEAAAAALWQTLELLIRR